MSWECCGWWGARIEALTNATVQSTGVGSIAEVESIGEIPECVEAVVRCLPGICSHFSQNVCHVLCLSCSGGRCC